MDRKKKNSSIYDYQLRLEEAVNKEDVQSITDLLEEVDINDDVRKKIFVKYRLYACSKAMAIKNLKLVKLLFPSDDIFHNGKLDEKMNMDLVDACIEADFKEGVQYLLTSGLVPDLPNKKWSALEESVRYSKLEVLRYLLSIDGINLNPNQDETLLMTACEMRNPQLIQMLLETDVRHSINARSKMHKQTALHYCLETDYYGDNNNLLECVQLLIQSGADPNLKANNETPVEMAANTGMIPTVTYLVISGATMDVRNNNNDSLLHILIRNAETYHDHDDAEYGNCIQALVNAGIDLNQTNINGKTPIYLAVANGSVNFVKSLIQFNCDVNTFPATNEPPISLSISQKHRDIAELLIRAGCDVNAADIAGITPLMEAARQCLPDIVTFLLEHGANIHAISKDKQTLLDFVFERSYYGQAIEAGYIEILRLLLDAGFDIHQSPGCLFKAVDLGYINLAKVLVDECANVDFTKECSGENALMLASQRGYTEIVAILVEIVTDINHKDHKGNTALLKAVIPRSSSKSNEIVDILLKYGGDPWVRNKKLQTLLMLAANNTVFVNFDDLLVNETYVNLQDEEGNTALMYAIINDRQRLIEDLLRHSADANLQNNRGETALMKAVRKDQVQMVKSLVLNGANVNLGDTNGKSALMFAIEANRVDNVRLLLQHGADLNLSDNNGKTPLIAAAPFLNREMVQMLLDSNADINLKDNDSYSIFQHVPISTQNRKWVNFLKLLLMRGGSICLDKRMKNGKTLLQCTLETKEADISWYLIIENCRLEDLKASDVIETFKCSDIFEVCKSLYLSGQRKDQTEMICMSTTTRSKEGVVQDGEEPSSNIDKFREFCQSMDLKSHCRRKIRECIGAGIQQKITKLGLPTSLQDFVLLKDVIPENHFTLTVDDKDDADNCSLSAMLLSVMLSNGYSPFGVMNYYDDDYYNPYEYHDYGYYGYQDYYD